MEKQQFNNSLTDNGGVAFLLMTCTYFAVTIIVKLILQALSITEGVIFYTLSGLIAPLSMCLVLGGISIKEKRNIFSVTQVKPFNPTFILYAVVLAVAMFFGFGFINSSIVELLSGLGLNVSSVTLKVTSLTEFIVYSIVFALLPALLEECFFRGLILDRLQGKTIPVAITVGLCFALYHGSFAQFVYQFIYGVSLTYLTIKAKSVLPSAIAHFINNFAVILLTYLGVEIRLDNVMVIVMGICLFIVFWVSLCCYQTKKWSVKHVAGPQSVTVKNFWLPFGLFVGLVFGVLMIVSLFIG